MSARSEGHLEIDRLKAVMRMVAYAIEEARALDADLFKYTLEVAHAAGAELVREAQAKQSYGTPTEHDPSIFIHLTPSAEA